MDSTEVLVAQWVRVIRLDLLFFSDHPCHSFALIQNSLSYP